MKKFLVTFAIVSMLVGCEETPAAKPSAEKRQQQETNKVMAEMDRQIGLPRITNFYEKKMAKEIFEMRDNSKLITYAYTQNLNGEFVYVGKCMGYGLPYSVQYTSPEKMGSLDGGQYGARNPYTVPQADPNGLYMPDGLSATWLMLIDEKTGKASPMYIEGEITVLQFKLPKRLVKKSSLTKSY